MLRSLVGSEMCIRDRAHTWKGPYVCVEHLQHNNLLIKPLNGRKTEKVHKNLCKLAPFRDQHLRLSEDFSALLPNYPPPASPAVGQQGDPEPWDDDMPQPSPVGPPAQAQAGQHQGPHNNPPANPPVPAPAGLPQPGPHHNQVDNPDIDNNPPVHHPPPGNPIVIQYPENMPVMGTPP